MTTFSVFRPVVPNNDLDIHPAPPAPWHRVAVACLWQDAKVARKRWPLASVVGPLRTMRGIDELVRGLLANPQIRVVIVDGPNLRPDVVEAMERSLGVSADGGLAATYEQLGDDVREAAKLLTVIADPPPVAFLPRSVREPEAAFAARVNKFFTENPGSIYVPTEDRMGGAIVLPPPKPPPVDELPHGDPGQRVAGETLADVWPRALEQAMRFGRRVPTSYGDTREVIALTSVIRNPADTLWETMGILPSTKPYTQKLIDDAARNSGGGGAFGVVLTTDADAKPKHAPCDLPHPLLGISEAQVIEYHRQLVGLDPPGDRPYSYGSRMRGGCERAHATSNGHDYHGDGTHCFGSAAPDQITNATALLKSTPLTRAAYLTPWRPAEDSGKESGRPCLVGVWFRAVSRGTETAEELRELAVERVDARHGYTMEFAPSPVQHREEYDREEEALRSARERTLHLVVAFRSHDLYAGYPLNAAALCLWLSEEAEAQGMTIGTLTMHSYSAHVYERDWAPALKVVAENPPPVVQWDQRSSWRVVKWQHADAIPNCEYTTPHEGSCGQPAAGAAKWYDPEGRPRQQAWCRAHQGLRLGGTGWVWVEGFFTPMLRAEALTPREDGGDQVLATFEAPSPGALMLQIARSGLVTEPSAGMWLGGEIERVWAARS